MTASAALVEIEGQFPDHLVSSPSCLFSLSEDHDPVKVGIAVVMWVELHDRRAYMTIAVMTDIVRELKPGTMALAVRVIKRAATAWILEHYGLRAHWEMVGERATDANGWEQIKVTAQVQGDVKAWPTGRPVAAEV